MLSYMLDLRKQQGTAHYHSTTNSGGSNATTIAEARRPAYKMRHILDCSDRQALQAVRGSEALQITHQTCSPQKAQKVAVMQQFELGTRGTP